MSSIAPCKPPFSGENPTLAFFTYNVGSFILNNDGYTVERLIHGMEASYNKVPEWAYSKLCEAFGPSYPTRYYRVETGDELEKLLTDPTFNTADRTQVSDTDISKLGAECLLIIAGGGVDP
jgi:pyruvate decarboxylase